MGRHALACCGATLALDDALEVGKGDAMTAHLDECSHDGSHHVSQEAVGGDLKAPASGRQLHPFDKALA